ncbi:MAG: hypothetical protein J5552_01130 [Prevotella sp.]|nr:hypothetical protein [Prevotella sp.]
MKQLFRRTTTLLRTVMLFGVLSFVSTQSKAQTQDLDLPDAFETVNPADIINDGNYYYVQFYCLAINADQSRVTEKNDAYDRSYLSDQGAGNVVRSKDYLPFTHNIQWKLVSTDTENQFLLQSRSGNYVYLDDGSFKCTADQSAATPLIFHQRTDGGFEISAAANTSVAMFRDHYRVWAEIHNYNRNTDGNCLRFAKLKDNVAHIIYYQDNAGFDLNGETRGGVAGFTNPRHYLTNSGAGQSLITNGNLEGNDVSSFRKKERGVNNNNIQQASISNDGRWNSRGIKVSHPNTTNTDGAQDWDTQFFITTNENLPEGTRIHLEFDYRASQNANVDTQGHHNPGTYTNNDGVGRVYFETGWKHLSQDFQIHDGQNGITNTITFNLAVRRQATDYFFDNIVMSVVESDVSTRPSIMNTYDAWALPTAAAYHKDGLWQLEEADADGTFYIKKYGTNDYLNASNAGGASVLGAKSNTNGEYIITDPDANRYATVQNANSYDAVALNTDMFYYWDGVGADANHATPPGNLNVESHLNQTLNPGNVVFGTGTVYYLTYADLTGCQKIVFEGTAGMELRVLLNRQVPVDGGDQNGGDLEEKRCTFDENGKAEVDVSDLPYVHLNSIKVRTNSGQVSSVTLQYPRYLTHSTDGNLVTQSNGNAGNLWGFLPVEVPTLNEDRTYKVVLKFAGNLMVNYGGGASDLDTENPDLWHLEQLDDYNHFRFGAYENYLVANGVVSGVSDARIYTYTDAAAVAGGDFDFVWYRTPEYEREVTHKISYLYDYAQQYGEYDLGKQGLATEAQSDWWNYEKRTQKVNHFEITHYIKFGETVQFSMPTVLNADNDHRMFQRWYNYDKETDIMGLLSHVSLNSSDGTVPYYLYKNGMVTGERLYWGDPVEGNRNPYLNAGQNPYALRYFNFTNSDGKRFTVAADVSRYSDMTYLNPESPLEDDLEEPSLTMRYIYYMRDAKEMAANLTSKPEQETTDVDDKKWLESKVFHFPSKPLAYEKEKLVGYRGEFIGIRHIFSDYWVFSEDDDVTEYNDGIRNGTNIDYLNNHLVSAVTNRNGGNIEVEIYDEGQTGIRLGGYNPDITLRNKEAWGDVVPQVGDYIRVYYTDRVNDGGDNNFNPWWKHWYNNDNNAPADWDSFQNSMNQNNNITDEYFQAQITSNDDLNEIIEHGLRFQGRGFTMVGVDLVRDNATIRTILRRNQGFGGWNVIVDVPPVNVANVEGDDDAYQGFFFYDKMYPYWDDKTSYGDSRFVSFRYPSDGNGGVKEVENTGENHKAYLRVYLRNPNNNKRYQIAQFTIIFDKDSETLPWKSVDGSVNDVENGVINYVQGTKRDPFNLRQSAGKPIAKITFDYPAGDTYHFPSVGDTRHANYPNPFGPGGTIANSSPIPLTFDKTNYSFDGDDCNWAAYAMVGQKSTRWGMQQMCMPANHGSRNNGGVIQNGSYGYAIAPDEGYQSGFLYIDASEQPGDICSAPFVGDFCAGDHLMISGWITGCNIAGGNDSRCPGGITLTIKGEHTVQGKKVTETLYRFCPGQVYELDDGTVPGEPGNIPGAYQNLHHVVWQQFYFEFIVQEKFDRHWLEVNNNCVSSTGGDFMLDNIEVYTIVPEIEPQINTPICIDKDGTVDMRLLKLNVDFNKQKSSAEVNPNAVDNPYIGFVFLEKDKFLSTLKAGKTGLANVSLEELADSIMRGKYTLPHTDAAYRAAFDAAFLGGKTKIWKSDAPETNMGAGLMYFQWSTTFENDAIQPVYSFREAITKQSPVFRETDAEGFRYLVLNGNYPELPWKASTDYYIIPTNALIPADRLADEIYSTFNLCSESCVRASVFQVEPPLHILSMEPNDDVYNLEVCEGKIPTLVAELTGFTYDGEEVSLQDLNYDWWLGDLTPPVDENDTEHPIFATLENYHKQKKTVTVQTESGSVTEEVRLDEALYRMRLYYPDITSLEGVIPQSPDPNDATDVRPELTPHMIAYLQELVDAGQLVLHQSSISAQAKRASADDPYFYLVACPIHDGYFDQALNHDGHNDVYYFCDEPQGVRIKVIDKAPTLKAGFVSGENGFSEYHYVFPEGTDPVLSIRLAKREQFETVQHGYVDEEPVLPTEENGPDADVADQLHYLWLPIRNAVVGSEGSESVIRNSEDYNVYLASTDDPKWDKKIQKAMRARVPSLPIFGKIVTLNAIDTQKFNGGNENDLNRLCIYFVKKLFSAEDEGTTGTDDVNNEDKYLQVREGYNYTLSLPFREDGENTCDGTLLINVKIVPDYEVWTGGADNTDWNNDQNWRRADGNTTTSTSVTSDGSKRNSNELYRSDDLPDDSKLKTYMTNYTNYRTAKDRILRKGFAPLYCTHILLKSNEWGNAPQLYDGLAGKPTLEASPFPNLRDKDGWDGTVTDETNNTVATKATATPILRFDMQARLYDIWPDTYGKDTNGDDIYPNKGREGDLIAEMYQINSCDEIAFQPGAELLNAHLLNYNNAWVEYRLDMNRWYLLGSPLQGTISGEWYAPSGETDTPLQAKVTGTGYNSNGAAQQTTTYYEPVTFGTGYDRYSPAIFQRSRDKAKAVLYEVGAEYANNDDSQTQNLGLTEQGLWVNNGASWNTAAADDYLDRLGYKPMGGNKANVAIKGVWSNTYNDAIVDYTKGGFSVMVLNNLKTGKNTNPAIVRLPKEDTMYDYYKYEWTGANDGGTDTELTGDEGVQAIKNRAKNRGRLKTDLLLPASTQKTETTASRYGDQRTFTRLPVKEEDLTEMNNSFVAQDNDYPATAGFFTEAVPVGESSLGYYLVENPFPCGLSMEAFFAANPKLQKKYWLLTKTGQHLVQYADDQWISPTVEDATDPTVLHFATAQAVLAPGQGFFVQADPNYTDNDVVATDDIGTTTTITFNREMQAQSRFGVKNGSEEFTIVVGTQQKMETKTIELTYDDDDDPSTPEVPLMIDDDDDPDTPEVQATTEVTVPVVDSSGNYVLEDITEDIVITTYVQDTDTDNQFPLLARTRAAGSDLSGMVITARRDSLQSSALVRELFSASNDFLPLEDTEVFLNSDLKQVPTVYTLCGRLATTINSIHEFRCLPVGVESNSSAPCTLTFEGVEHLGDSVAFYDAVERTLTPLKSGMKFKVSGQTQNRYYLVRSLNLEEAAVETHLQIFTEGLTAKVIASTQEPLTSVRCYDTGGRLVHAAQPQTPDYSFTLASAGVYIIEAQTEHDRKSQKHICK